MKNKRSIGTLILVLLFCIISLGNVGCGHKRGTIYQTPDNNPNLQNTYTVTFDSNGGSYIPVQNVQEGQTAMKPENPIKDGYSFQNWNTDELLTSEFDFNTPITQNIILYAKWEAEIAPVPVTQYTVSFNPNGGSAVESQTVNSGDKANVPDTPTRDGYSFQGWYTNSELTNLFSFNSIITADITLYAKWSKLPYTITFNSNGGSNVASQYVNDGETATMPENPTKNGWIFIGWYKDEEFTQIFTFGTDGDKITENIRLYAQWLDADLLVAQYAASEIVIGYSTGDNPKYVTGNLDLPTKIDSADITWDSNSGVVASDGIVNRQATDVNVILTATATYNNKSAEKSFDIKVIKKRIRKNNEIRALPIEETSSGDIIVERTASGNITDIEGQYVSFDIENADDALDAITVLKNELGINSPNRELETFLVTSDNSGTEYQFQQVYNGVKVYGRSVMVSANTKGEGDFLHSDFLSSDVIAEVDTKACISQQDAEAIAKTTYIEDVEVDSNITEKVIYSLDDYQTTPVYVYIVRIYCTNFDESVFINANTHEIIRKFSNINDAHIETGWGYDDFENHVSFDVAYEYSGAHLGYFMRNPELNIQIYQSQGLSWLLNTPVRSIQNKWTDSHQITAYTNICEIIKWWRTKFNRNSLDNKGMKVDVVTHAFGKSDNASWMNILHRIHTYDSADKSNLDHFYGAAIDVLTHETTHAIIQYDVPDGLPNEKATGAINEGYADVFGCIKDENWKFGESLFDKRFLKTCVRNIAEPYDLNAKSQAYDLYTPTEEIYNIYETKDEDASHYVHQRSFKISHAAYLMHEECAGKGIGLTWDELAKVWYKSIHVGLNATSKFEDVRRCVIWSAQKLSLPDIKRTTIKKAFDSIGICSDNKLKLRGTVTDYNTNEFISNADITIWDTNSSSLGQKVSTSLLGRYSTELEGYGYYKVIINKDGYVSLIAFPTLNESEDTILDVQLVKPGDGFVSGTIYTSPDKTPLNGVRLNIKSGWFSQNSSIIATTTTDANGQYSFDLGENGAGYYTIKMIKSGYENATFNVIVSGVTTNQDGYLSDGTSTEEDIPIDEGHFPDLVFRNYIKNYCDNDNDGFLSKAELEKTTKIDVSYNWDISSLQGIKYFDSLEELNCDGRSYIISLDISNCSSLKTLSCRNSRGITELNASGCTSLKTLDCKYTPKLNIIDVSGCTSLEILNCDEANAKPFESMSLLDASGCVSLRYLNCGYSHLATLNISNCISLEEMYLTETELTSLDVSKCTSLKILICGWSSLATLNVNKCTSLERLSCEHSRLTTLNVSGCTSLRYLNCYNDTLSTLDVSGCTSLEELDCSSNKLTTLDVSGCTSLRSLICNNNVLGTLNVSDCFSLEGLNCSSNKLTTLDVSGCSSLRSLTCDNNVLSTLNVSDCFLLEELNCEYNELKGLELTNNNELSRLTIYGNPITKLDLSNTAITTRKSPPAVLTKVGEVYCDDSVEITFPISATATHVKTFSTSKITISTLGSINTKSSSIFDSTIIATLPEFQSTASCVKSFDVSLDVELPVGSELFLINASEDLHGIFAIPDTEKFNRVSVVAQFEAGKKYSPVIVATTDEDGSREVSGCNTGTFDIITCLLSVITILKSTKNKRFFSVKY